MSKDPAHAPQPSQRTWNTPEPIDEHRRMTPEARFQKAVELSQAALRFASAPRTDGR